LVDAGAQPFVNSTHAEFVLLTLQPFDRFSLRAPSPGFDQQLAPSLTGCI
jgi:hypothetical protein